MFLLLSSLCNVGGFPMLADLGLERSPTAERGLVVLAVISCVLATVSIAAGARRLLKGVPPSSGEDDPERGWPFMRRTLTSVMQILIGIFVVFALGKYAIPRPRQPEGWQVINPPQEASALAVAEDVIWAGGREGLLAIDRQTHQHRQTPLDRRDLRGVRSLLKESEVLLVACRQGLLRFDGSESEWLQPPSGAELGPAYALCRTRDASLWVGVDKGVWQIQSGNWVWHGEQEGLRLPTVEMLHEDAAGLLWAGSMEPEAAGLWRRDGATWKLYDHSSGLVSHAVNGMLEDSSGKLWVALGFGTQGGAQYLDGDQWSAPLELPGLEGQKIRSLFEDSHGRLWFCSEYDGVCVRDDERWLRLTTREGLPGNELKKMAEDDKGLLWMGTERGLGLIEKWQTPE